MSDLNDLGQKAVNAAMLDNLAAKQDHISALQLQAALSSGSSLRNDQTRKAEERASLIAAEKRKLEIIVDRQAAELAAKDALILEWMHSNEAFKQLARNYGKKLGISDEQRKDDFAHAVVDVAEEDPKFANTQLADSKRQQIKSAPKP